MIGQDLYEVLGGEPYDLHVEIRFDGTTWVDVTADVMRQQVGIFHGRRSAGANVQAGSLSFVLLNMHGHYTPDHPLSPYWPHVALGIEIRARVGDNMRFWGEVWEWHPTWPEGDLSEVSYDQLDDDEALRGEARVRVVANGLFRRIDDDDAPLDSALRQHYTSGTLYGQLVAYLPLEDGPGTRDVANLVEGQFGVRYARGAAPDFPREPGYAQDNTCPGSAPLPVWPVISAVGWSRGASVAPPPLQGFVIQMAIRVPPDSGQVNLCEWHTSGGTYNAWRLSVTSGGVLQVTATDDADTPSTVTFSSSRQVDDGAWRPIQVAVGPVGQVTTVWLWANGDYDESSDNSTLGTITAIRPRPTFTDPEHPDGSDKDPVGLGHVAVIARDDPTSGSVTGLTRIIGVVPPVDGYDGERAADRFERLMAESGIPYRTVRPVVAVDGFDRTVAEGWGAADTGGVWELDGPPSAFSVADGDGLIVAAVASTRRALLPPQHTDVDVRAIVSTSTADGTMGVTARADLDSYRGYEAMLDIWTGDAALVLYRVDDGDVTANAWRPVVEAGGFQVDARWWLRMQCDGQTIRAKVWLENTSEPGQWQLSVQDSTYSEGRVGVVADAFGGSPILSFAQFTAGQQGSSKMGPQQLGTLIDNLNAVANVDGGILGERIDGLGLTLRTLGSLYNQQPTMPLDASAGEIINPYTPVLDDRDIVNILTVNRVNGGAAFGSVDEGPKSSAPPPEGSGPKRKQVTVNVESDEQLPGQVGWRLHIGTWPGARYPSVSPALNEQPHLHDIWSAVRQGDLVEVTGLPPQHPPGPVDALALGWSETISPYDWSAQVWAMPYGPYEVGEVTATPGPGLVVDGQLHSCAQTPHTAALAITGDIDLRVDATGDWSPADIRTLIAKFDMDVLEGQGQWWLSLNPQGLLRFGYSNTGTDFQFRIATVAPAARVSQGGRLAVRATFQADVDGQNICTFYTAPSIEGPWEQLGDIVVQSGAVTMHDGIAPLEVGTRSQGTEQPWVGTIHAAEVRDSNGTVVANPRFDRQPPGTTEFDDGAGRHWTLCENAEIDGDVTDARGQAVDTDRSTLVNAIGDSQTVFEVVTDLTHPLAAPWTTDPTDWDPSYHGGPLTIVIGGEHMDIQSIHGEPAPAQVFSSSVGSGFGPLYPVEAPPMMAGYLLIAFQTADLGSLASMGTPTGGGEPWQESATQSGQGRPSKLWWKIVGESEPARWWFSQSQFADGGCIIVAVANPDPDHLPPMALSTSQAGSGSTVTTPSTSPDGPNLGLRFVSASPGNDLVELTPPGGYETIRQFNQDGFVVAAGAARDNDGGGATGQRLFAARTEDGPATVAERHGFTVNVVAASAQTFVVVRGTNGFTKPHAAGEPVHVAYPARVAL